MTDESQSRGPWRKAVVRLLALAARPARRAQGRSGTVIEAYRGYGTSEEIFLIGRVFRQSVSNRKEREDDIRASLRNIAHRIRRRKVAGTLVTARIGGTETRVTTDRDGYFRVHLHPHDVPSSYSPWRSVELSLDAAPAVRAEAQVYIPPTNCRFVVISDIDDTIMHTGVANKLKMLWRLFVADAESRVAFPGAAALCRALHTGVTGDDANPMLYVSRAPWGIYDMLDEFFRQHEIPVGPVLFLREWGLSWRHPLPRRAEDHKRELISHMLALYRDLPFVLIGDSGQHDPEVYAQVVADHPGRVLAVYIRNVSRGAGRVAEIEHLAATVAAAGSSLVLAADSDAMAQHAGGLGLIAPEGGQAVSAERAAAGAAEVVAETQQVVGPTAAATSQKVADGKLKSVLEEGSDTPLNVVVEPANRGGLSTPSDAN
ncbi:App1 family protein [Methylobacterium oxalidis]|uniref:App1 family protein n=1 Tax=Methylobacterium oxalidis TaxID=944322 RepID=UPI0011BDDC68|nr:phosphatase domain-containing protein [Methylobacterium oxalidis]